MNNETQTQETQEENFVYEVEEETPVVEEKTETSSEKKDEENRTIVRNLTRRQQSQRQPVQRRLLFPWLAAPEYRTIVTSYGYLERCEGVSLEDLVKN